MAISYSVQAQSTTGILLDQNTGKSIPFAKIQTGEQCVLIHNTRGAFEVELTPEATDSLTFSAMGYQSNTLSLKNDELDTVYLRPSTYQKANLPIVNEKLQALDLMKMVKKNLSDNYQLAAPRFTVSMRHKSMIKPQQLGFEILKANHLNGANTAQKIKAAINRLIRKNKKTNTVIYRTYRATGQFTPSGGLTVLPQKAKVLNKAKGLHYGNFMIRIFKQLAQHIKTENYFRFRSGIITINNCFDLNTYAAAPTDADSLTKGKLSLRLYQLLNQGIFSEDRSSLPMARYMPSKDKIPVEFILDHSLYEYTLEGASMYKGSPVYVVSFKPASGTSGKFEGSLYISPNTFAILKEHYRLAVEQYTHETDLKFLLNSKYEQDLKSGTLLFTRLKTGKYVLKYLRMTGRQYTHFDRKFHLKENACEKDPIKLKYGVTLNFTTAYENEWVFSGFKPSTENP